MVGRGGDRNRQANLGLPLAHPLIVRLDLRKDLKLDLCSFLTLQCLLGAVVLVHLGHFLLTSVEKEKDECEWDEAQQMMLFHFDIPITRPCPLF